MLRIFLLRVDQRWPEDETQDFEKLFSNTMAFSESTCVEIILKAGFNLSYP
jgi:hypothetical protein